MIKCLVLDFDGTILLSNKIKKDAFFTIASQFTGGVSLMRELLAFRDKDRYQVFNLFAKKLSLDAVGLSAQYDNLVLEELLSCPERSGAEHVIRSVKGNGFSVYINSATPQAPLERIVSLRFPEISFDGLFGCLGKKSENLHSILSIESISPNEVVFIGDGIDDFEAARNVGSHFIGIPNGSLSSKIYSGRWMCSFNQLSVFLEEFNGNKRPE